MVLLFDLEADPGETLDASADHPEVLAFHRRRIDELSQRFRAHGPATQGPTAEDRERLRSLGYLEQIE